MISFSSIAFEVCSSSKSTNKSVSLSHAQQLVAASFGYKSLASYQASNDVKSFPANEAVHFVLDHDLFRQRYCELKVQMPFHDISMLVSETLKKLLPRAHIHASNFELDSHVRSETDAIVLNSGRVSGEAAMTNSDGIREIHLPFDDIDLQRLEIGDAHVEEVMGHVTMNPDLERPYSGHIIDVDFSITLQRISKVCLLEPIIEINNAKLNFAWNNEDEYEPPRISIAEALATHFGLDLEEAQELEDAEPVPEESEDGHIYRYWFDFKSYASPTLANKLLSKFGSLQLEVPPWFFDGIRQVV